MLYISITIAKLKPQDISTKILEIVKEKARVNIVNPTDRFEEDLGFDSVDIPELAIKIEAWLKETTGRDIYILGKDLDRLKKVNGMISVYTTKYAQLDEKYQTN